MRRITEQMISFLGMSEKNMQAFQDLMDNILKKVEMETIRNKKRKR